MALNPSGLTSGLTTAFDSPGSSVASAAQGWATAVNNYVIAIVPPSITIAAATATLTSALASAFAVRPTAAPAMEAAFLAFATTLGAGMAPAFVATPPVGQIGFAAQFAGARPSSHAIAASQISALIDAWFRTGIATPIVGPPVVWS